MPNKMIEKVAKAIEDEVNNIGYTENIGRFYYVIAKAAIAAMREPTEKMIKDGEPIVYSCFSLEPGEGLDENPAVPTWEAMIDAALKE